MAHEEVMVRIEHARAALIQDMKRKFYGVLVSNVEPVISTTVETAGTNGRKHFWNPTYVSELTQDELIGVQAHESEHDARKHGTRRGNRNPFDWNVACDYAINWDLIQEGFTLPKGALIDKRFAGMSAEEIYRIRELEKKAPPPQEPEGPEGDDDETEEGLDDADVNPPGKPEGDDDSDDTDGDDAEGEETGDEGDGDDGDDEGKETGKGAGDDADGDDGEETGEGDGGDADGEDGEAGKGEGSDGDDGEAGEAGQGEGEGEGEGGKEKGKQGTGDVGRCGEVLDAADDANEVAALDNHWDKIVRQAVSMAKGIGHLPGHATSEIERASNPPRDWRDELREFCEQGALRRETWNRPNRRFTARGMILPSTQKDGVSKAAFLIDTSGSMDDIALACIQDEAQQLLDDGIIDEIVVVYGDTEVTRVDEYVTGDDIEFDPKGRGGTDMKPLFQYVADEISDASLVINFTDLEIGDAGEEPHCPVLFAVHGHPYRVKELMDNAPWGARCIDVGAH